MLQFMMSPWFMQMAAAGGNAGGAGKPAVGSGSRVTFAGTGSSKQPGAMAMPGSSRQPASHQATGGQLAAGAGRGARQAGALQQVRCSLTWARDGGMQRIRTD